MKKLFLLLSALFFLFQLNSQTLNSIESVEYDHSNNRFLISNGNSIIARASDGQLSFFGTGMASYGMEVLHNTLFVINGASIWGFDLDTEEAVMSINISGTSFLNGLTNNGIDQLYATDFGSQKVYKIDVSDFNNPTFEIIVNNTGATPNGIVFDGDNNRLVFVNWGSNAPIKAVDLNNYSVSTLVTTSFGNIDGIDEDNEGNFYISSWIPGQIAKYDNLFQNPPQIITTPFLSSPADICYAKEIDTLAIPHYPSGGNEVVYIGFENTTSSVNLSKESFNLSIAPNPVTDQSKITFQLNQSRSVQLQLLSSDGKVIQTLMEGTQIAGEHTISFLGMDLSPGVYWLSLQSGNLQKTIAINCQ